MQIQFEHFGGTLLFKKAQKETGHHPVVACFPSMYKALSVQHLYQQKQISKQANKQTNKRMLLEKALTSLAMSQAFIQLVTKMVLEPLVTIIDNKNDINAA